MLPDTLNMLNKLRLRALLGLLSPWGKVRRLPADTHHGFKVGCALVE